MKRYGKLKHKNNNLWEQKYLVYVYKPQKDFPVFPPLQKQPNRAWKNDLKITSKLKSESC